MKSFIQISVLILLFGISGAAFSQCPNGNQEGGLGIPGLNINDIIDQIRKKLGEFEPIIQNAIDPNEIIGPEGYSQRRMISSHMKMPYTILFENDPDFATATVQVVQIRQTFAPFTDVSTFEVGNFGFGKFVFEVPPGLNHYQKRLDLRDSLNIYLNVTAGIDIVNQELFWVFESLDPKTGQLPFDPTAGFLPVNDTLIHNGEGFVSYTIRPYINVNTGDSITAKASIIFDINAPIETNTTFNVIDAIAPTSEVVKEYSVVNDSLLVSWDAHDDSEGSGVAWVDIYGCNEEGIFVALANQVTESPVKIPFNAIQDYRFFSIATDHVGNKEAIKQLPDLRILQAGKNHAPFLIKPFKDLVILKNTQSATLASEINSHFIDEDNETLNYSVSAQQNNGLDSIKIENLSLTAFPAKEFKDHILIQITATDASNASAKGSMLLGFRDINNAPELIQALKDTMVYVGNRFTYAIPKYAFKDNDTGDKLSFTVNLHNGQALPAWLLFYESELLLSGIPKKEDIGMDTIRVVATDPFNLTASDLFTIEVVDAVGIEEIMMTNNKVNLYPNPTADILHIRFDQPLNEAIQVKIVDLSGRVISSKKLINQESEINVSAYVPGVYIVVLMDEKEYTRIKFIKL